MGQSPFAIQRGQTFERSLFRDEGESLRTALQTARVLPAEAAGLADFRLRLNGGRFHSLDDARSATSARRIDTIALVCREAAALVLAGDVIGMASAMLAARAMSSLLFRVTPYDPAIFLGTPVVLAGIAIIASYLPARRAAGVEAAIALRHDE